MDVRASAESTAAESENRAKETVTCLFSSLSPLSRRDKAVLSIRREKGKADTLERISSSAMTDDISDSLRYFTRALTRAGASVDQSIAAQSEASCAPLTASR